MIRKIIAGTFLIYLALWLAAAYMIEHELHKLFGPEFQAKKVKISGFPLSLKFNLIDPEFTIKSESEVQVFKSELITMTIGFSLKKIKFELADKWTVESKNSKKYKLINVEFDPSPKMVVKLAKPLIFIKNRLVKNLHGLAFESDNLYAYADDEELFALTDTSLYLRHIYLNDTHGLSFVANTNYVGKADVLSFESMRFVCDGDVEYTVDSENSKIMLEALELEDFELDINDNTYLGLFGEVELSDNGLPYGKFDLELQNSSELIELLWPSTFEMTAAEAKNILDAAGGKKDDGEISLPITFSSSGILINGKTIEELREE